MEDVAQVVIMLALLESRFVNGADLVADGAITVGMLISGEIPGA